MVRLSSATTASAFDWYLSIQSSKAFVPQDWKIIETSPGGLDKDFVNIKTNKSTWYTPEGATAAEILEVPDASKYWSSVQEVEKYIKKMAAEKEQNGGKDV